MQPTPVVSFVLATHNRRQVTLETLGHLYGDRRPGVSFEVLVVDNASTDGTPEAIRRAFPEVVLLAEGRNLGSCAKALAADRAVGTHLVFLDDDSFPRPGSIDRMLDRFEAEPRLGAAGFRVHLPDGREECSALPNVFVGCGVGFRADALRAVGGLDRTLFMQAEEYDLAFRLINAGWRVETYADLHVDHLKTPRARRSSRTVYYDTRNNLLVAARYLPAPWAHPCCQDWQQRYGWLAGAEGRRAAYRRGVLAGRVGGWRDRRRYRRDRLGPEAVERIFRFAEIEERMHELRSAGVRRILFADLGKNILAFHRGAGRAGLAVLAIADDRFAVPGRQYRGVPILPVAEALGTEVDACVVSNTSPVHATVRAAALKKLTHHPVRCWFTSEACWRHSEIRSMPPAGRADNTHATNAAAAG